MAIRLRSFDFSPDVKKWVDHNPDGSIAAQGSITCNIPVLLFLNTIEHRLVAVTGWTGFMVVYYREVNPATVAYEEYVSS